LRIFSGAEFQTQASPTGKSRMSHSRRMAEHGNRGAPRPTNVFSKKAENQRAVVALHFAHCNFVRQHKSLRVTAALAAGVSDRLWTLEGLVEQISEWSGTDDCGGMDDLRGGDPVPADRCTG
jgi:hypothetical protein